MFLPFLNTYLSSNLAQVSVVLLIFLPFWWKIPLFFLFFFSEGKIYLVCEGKRLFPPLYAELDSKTVLMAEGLLICLQQKSLQFNKYLICSQAEVRNG